MHVMAVWRSYNKKNAPNGHYHLNRAVTPDQITQQNSLQRAGGPYRALKTLLGLISRPIFDLGFFKKANVTKRCRKEVVRKSRHS
jgi:hypothetical protein